MPVEQFMEFAGRRNVPLHYGADELEEDRRTLERLGL
jgi:predicted HTH domain antitoxin